MISTIEDIFFLELPEAESALLDGAPIAPCQGSIGASQEPSVLGAPWREASALESRIAARRREREANMAVVAPKAICRDKDAASPQVAAKPQSPHYRPMAAFLTGAAISPGTRQGRARVILEPTEAHALQPGEILVARAADPGWTPLYFIAAAVAVDVGGVLSHAAVMAREYGVPAVAGLEIATQVIHTGDWIEVDGDAGQVRVIERAGAQP